jgi:hypothetical protein
MVDIDLNARIAESSWNMIQNLSRIMQPKSEMSSHGGAGKVVHIRDDKYFDWFDELEKSLAL